MDGLPDYDGSVRMREAVRRGARRLAIEKGISFNRQATFLNAYLSKNKDLKKFAIAQIPHATWTEFAKPGSKRVLLNDTIIQVAWNWMSDDHSQIAQSEYGDEVDVDTQILKGISGTLFDKGIHRSERILFENLTGSAFDFIYKPDFADDVMCRGHIMFFVYKGSSSFLLERPYYDKHGELEIDRCAGTVVQFDGGFLLIGSDGAQRRTPIVIIINDFKEDVSLFEGCLICPAKRNHLMPSIFVMIKTASRSVDIAKLEDIVDFPHFYELALSKLTNDGN